MYTGVVKVELNKIYNMDCLEGSNGIESGSVDLVLTDLPYGTLKGVTLTSSKTRSNEYSWDTKIDTNQIYKIANRILRKNGRMILFAQQPYTTELIANAIPNIPHLYNMVWEKNDFANALLCNKAPVSYYEDILIFSKTESYTEINPLKDVMHKYVEEYGKEFIVDLFKKEGRYTSDLSAKVHASYKFGFNKGMRFDLMDKKLYEYLSAYIKFKETYEALKIIDDQFKRDLPSTFNLWEGKKFKSNILKYKKDYGGLHPTQKPILLLEDLIKTFSNERDLVVDLTIGSGSTAIAALNTGRFFIGYELGKNHFDIANERILKYKAVVK